MDTAVMKSVDDIQYEEKIQGRWLTEIVNGRPTYYMSQTSTWNNDDMAAITIQPTSDGKYVAFKNHHEGRSTPVKVMGDLKELIQWCENYSPVRILR